MLFRRSGSFVASTSMLLLWVIVGDGSICLSDGVSDVLQESVRRCSPRAQSFRDCTACMVGAVTWCFCCGLLVALGHGVGSRGLVV